MKRPSTALRLRQMKAALRELDKRRNREGFGRIHGAVLREQRAEFESDDVVLIDTVVLRLWGDLDIIENTDHCLRQFEELRRTCVQLKRPTRVVLQLDDVTSLDAAALLFLVSRIRFYGSRPHIRFMGTYPKSDRALRTLRDANFGDFMSGRMRDLPSRDPTLRLAQGAAGAKVKPEIGAEMRTFLQQRNPALSIIETDTVSLAVGECLENVRLHAYESGGTRREGWYVVGEFNAQTSTSAVAILDMGVGIQATLKGKLGSRLRELITSPADFLEKATEGVTATGDPKHGKGLRAIRSFVGAKEGMSLHLLSSGGKLRVSRLGVEKSRTMPFTGTIVCVQICNSQVMP